MSTDSETLFKQARLEIKAAGAYFEATLSADRYIHELKERIQTEFNNAYRKSIAIGVPHWIAEMAAMNIIGPIKDEAIAVREEGLELLEKANYHRRAAESLLLERERVLAKENHG
jgi:hypothetical protein